MDSFNEEAWLDAIEREYGVRLGPRQVYVDARRGYVYAGSEYVARVSPRSHAPEDATEWAGSIAHLPRIGGYTGPLEVAARKDDAWLADQADQALPRES